ncbi:hypothetical protein [Aureivirga marina]|uniref:hypothetical protein n=1 Tax=Aureivirga marina TaxID=1182451 RepID=UPI0018CB7E2F|nr:hypothetical protein [Aureivirga marina]
MRKKKNYESELEGIHYEILTEWVANGKNDVLDEEMTLYLEQIDLVRDLYYKWKVKKQIVKILLQKYPDLSKAAAETRYHDSMNFFYSDRQTKKEAYRAMLAEKIETLANLAATTARDEKGIITAGKLLKMAYEVSGAGEKEPEKLPEHLLIPKTPIYTINADHIEDLERVDRNMLAAQIDSMDITEKQKDKLKSEAQVEPFKMFNEEDD